MHTHTHAHTHTQAHTHTHTHTLTHARRHTYTHTYIHKKYTQLHTKLRASWALGRIKKPLGVGFKVLQHSAEPDCTRSVVTCAGRQNCGYIRVVNSNGSGTLQCYSGEKSQHAGKCYTHTFKQAHTDKTHTLLHGPRQASSFSIASKRGPARWRLQRRSPFSWSVRYVSHLFNNGLAHKKSLAAHTNTHNLTPATCIYTAQQQCCSGHLCREDRGRQGEGRGGTSKGAQVDQTLECWSLRL